MASSYSIICTHCSFHADGWDDGQPYYLDLGGLDDGQSFGLVALKKVYASHPSPESDRCNFSEHRYTCLSCAKRFKNDTGDPTTQCPRCKGEDLCADSMLHGKACPKCKKGKLHEDPDAERSIS